MLLMFFTKLYSKLCTHQKFKLYSKSVPKQNQTVLKTKTVLKVCTHQNPKLYSNCTQNKNCTQILYSTKIQTVLSVLRQIVSENQAKRYLIHNQYDTKKKTNDPKDFSTTKTVYHMTRVP